MSDTQTTTRNLKDLDSETQYKVVMLTGKGLFFVARVGELTAKHLLRTALSSVYALDTTRPELPVERELVLSDLPASAWADHQHPLYLFSTLQMFEVEGQYVLFTDNLNCPYNALTLSKINIQTPALKPFILNRFADLTWERFWEWCWNYLGMTTPEITAILDAATRPANA